MTEKFTGLLADIAEIAGDDVAAKVAVAVRGVSVSIPPRAIAGHWLTETVGMATADLICRGLAYTSNEGRVVKGVVKETVPLGSTALMRKVNAEARRLLDTGMPVPAVAIAVGLHERSVWRIKAKAKAPDLHTLKRVQNLIRTGRADQSIARSTNLNIHEIRALREQLSKKGKLQC